MATGVAGHIRFFVWYNSAGAGVSDATVVVDVVSVQQNIVLYLQQKENNSLDLHVGPFLRA